ncbi:MAG: hypothetical protein AV945_gp08 [Phormidium phage MIS-PhV1B]|jgi:hypothetical protein|uniref:hypothetical protein n=1 Tax=Phormidium phage MIS-PhV1B TaxID=1391456 RepID=UPI0003C9C623|nr:MAG: hypothetical protein AV945_gp08 [Phormidium phage MIS-PhV1B]AGZ61815.1 MAG: hypothetical protein [Phormidium phage MIS-PhV1B]
MFQIKFVVCMASYAIGAATESFELSWLGQTDWVDEFDDAEFFNDEIEAQARLKAEEVHGIDPRSLSIIKVLWSDFSD